MFCALRVGGSQAGASASHASPVTACRQTEGLDRQLVCDSTGVLGILSTLRSGESSGAPRPALSSEMHAYNIHISIWRRAVYMGTFDQ